MNQKKILVSGGDSRFCYYLKQEFKNDKILYLNKKQLNILNYVKLLEILKKKKIKIFIHIAALSRPMEIHEKNIDLSIQTNIIGTANVVRACKKLNIKLVYFSTNYVYPCENGNYKETDSLFPFNNYGWSKLGGECAVHMLKNFLILRLSITDFPFSYKKAIRNAYSSLIYNRDFAKIFPFLIKEKGILNIGGKRQSIYNFAKKDNFKIKGINISKKSNFPFDSSLNIKKFKKIMNNKKFKKILS
jgi:dTDP-4-dehydrorhamnose reductase